MKKSVSIVGGGTAGLFLAGFLNTDIYDVTIFEKKSSLGRKFLVAGDGGFNLTHSEALDSFKLRYTPTAFLDRALVHFSNADLIAWLSERGIPTFVGSSGRIFPEKGIKPIEVLKSIKEFLINKHVKFEFDQTFTGWNGEGDLEFSNDQIVKSDYIVFALGGGSWKVTGSDGSWLDVFEKKGVKTIPFRSSNCAFQIDWDKKFIEKHEGTPLKNISISIGSQTQKGEAVITKFGIEGNAIYALSPKLQNVLAIQSEVEVHLDFKPTMSLEAIEKKMRESESNMTTTLKEVIKLNRAQVDLIKSTKADSI